MPANRDAFLCLFCLFSRWSRHTVVVCGGGHVCNLVSILLFPLPFYYKPLWGHRGRRGPHPPWLVVVSGDFCRVCFFSFVLFLAFWSVHLYLVLSKSLFKSRSGVLRTGKLTPLMIGVQGYQMFPLLNLKLEYTRSLA